jgi:DNA-binding NarL/FixJ family response regulator
MGQRIRVLIADDHAHARRGLRALLSTSPALEVICEAENGREAALKVEEFQPDVVIMDIQMPVWDGLEATRYIKAKWPGVAVIALTIRASWHAAALSAGVDEFLVKGCPSRELIAAIRRFANVYDSGSPSVEKPGESSAAEAGNHRPTQLTAVMLTV